MLLGSPLHAQTAMHLVDDRGRSIDEDVELCFWKGLETSCIEIPPGRDEVELPAFDLLAVEGSEHGPVRMTRRDLGSDDTGRRVLVVPRKARLEVRRLPEQSLQVSLYDAVSPQFRRPAWRRSVAQGALAERPLRVPAGRFVAVLTERGNAPDLHLLDAKPGERLVLAYRSRRGWSLLLRTATRSGEPVPDANLELEPAAGYGTSPAEKWSRTTDGDGLAVVSGITMPLLTARAEHPEFVDAMRPGLTASPGTFAFEEVVVLEGGTVRVQVTLNGEPAVAATCEIKRPFRPTRYDEVDPNPPVFRGPTSEEGVCEARVAEGEYILGVEPSELPRHARWASRLQAVDQQETRIDVDLIPIRVTGEVLRGNEPASDYTIRIAEAGGIGRRTGPPLVEVQSDEEGRYETVIWQEAEYSVVLRDPKGFVSDMEIARLEPPETTVDFLLAEAEITGIVVDDEGNPIPEAPVSLQWPEEGRQEFRLTVTDDTGAFSYSVDQNTGLAVVEAGPPGYERDKETIEIRSGIVPPPVELVLKRLDVVAGTVRTSSGAPLPGAHVAAYADTPGLDSIPVGLAVTDDQGRFELARAQLDTTQIFVTGPGCPLTTFDPSRPNLDLTALDIACAALPAALRLTLTGEDGAPFGGASLYLRRGREVVPRQVLRVHQQTLGLPEVTDGSGRLTLVGLEPGTYDLYLGGVTNTAGILSGRPDGHLASTRLEPLETKELAITIRSSSP